MIENGILKADGVNGISNYEVARVLGEKSLDFGSLCVSDHINKWAKYKPLALMAANDTNRELTEAQKKGYQEGGYTKPYGVYPVRLTPATYSLGWQTANQEEATLLEASEWKYSKPQANGAISVNGEGAHIFTRMIDFNGYNHIAKPVAEVVWKKFHTKVEDGESRELKGIFADITLSDGSGNGLAISDFVNWPTVYAVMFVQTIENVNIPETGKSQLRYAIAWEGVTVSKGGTVTIGVTDGVLSGLSGSFNFIVALTDRQPTYGVYSTTNVQDGWMTPNRVWFYPKLTNTLDCVIVDGGVKRMAVNDVANTTIFLTDGVAKPYASIIDVDGTELTAKEYINMASGASSVTIKLKEEINSYKRRLSFKGSMYGGRTEVQDYLNYCYQSGTFYGGCKPLVKNLPMTNGMGNAYYASFYVRFNSVTDVKLCMDVTNVDGTLLTTKELSTFDTVDRVLKIVSFVNEVNVRGKVSGMHIEISYGYYASTYEREFTEKVLETVDLSYTENGTTYYPYLPVSDLVVGLPNTKQSSASGLGGRLEVDLGIYYTDLKNYDMFVRRDNLEL